MNNTIFPVAVLAAMLSVAMPEPLMLPSTAALEPKIKASLENHGKGDYAGAINTFTSN